MSDLKKVIFDYIRKNPDILQKENSNDLLFKKFYPNVTEPEDVKYKKKYISKIKNEFLKVEPVQLSETVPDKLGEVTSEPVKVIPVQIDIEVIKNVVSDKIKEKLILSVSEQQKLLELLKNPEPEQHQIEIPVATGNGEKERYNIRILISVMNKLKKFAKKNNTNASAVIEYLINTYL